MYYSAILTGQINEQEVYVNGEGEIIDGVTQGDYILEKLPDIFEPEILQAVMITGYPNACNSIDGSPNVFKGQSYSYKRNLSFSNGGYLEMEANITLTENKLISAFKIDGKLDCNELIDDAQPIIEIWQPTSENNLSGLFRITWKTKSGKYLTADAHSLYMPEGVSQDSPILHRFIEISSKTEGKKFSLLQNSKLFYKI